MRKSPLVLALLLASGAAGAVDSGRLSPAATLLSGGTGTRTYVVTFDEAPLAVAGTLTKSQGASRARLDVTTKANRDYLAKLDRRHGDFVALAAKALGRSVLPRHRYRVTSNGMALALTADEAQRIRQLPGVARVVADRMFERRTETSTALIGAPGVWNAPALATKGEGVVVGILDGGINATHPSFADVGGDGYDHTNPRGRYYGLCATAPGCNDKLIGIYDFRDGATATGGDDDGHGSHVASTAAGNVVTLSTATPTLQYARTISGVAPHANVISYRVCLDEDEGCAFSLILEALDQATIDQVDVVNISIGHGDVDPWATVREPDAGDYAGAILNARTAGVLVVAAGGNDGPGPGTVDQLAPWTLTVAASTHGRVVETALSGITGSGIATPLTLTGRGITGGLARARVVHAKDYGNALCGTGPTQAEPDGASNPFPAGTFAGEIVICDRGIYGRVEKGFNLRAAGAGGMVLANAAAQGESLVEDAHHLPAVHIGFTAGQQLSQLVENARTGGGSITAAITGAATRTDAGLRDVVADYSGRGPVTAIGGWLKPNVAAPGSAVVAASHVGAELLMLDGTSMASPHVAGAAALLAAAHPAWTPSQLESALLTTATAGMRDFDGTAATPDETGAGRVQVDAALRAGLFFETTRDEFVAADPELDGRPAALNRPYLVDDECLQTCTFRRTVTDMAGGATWRVELDAATASVVSVSPAQFTLAAGGSTTLVFQVDVSAAPAGTWVGGDIVLRSTRTDVSAAHVPLHVFSTPGTITDEARVTTPSNTGSATYMTDGSLLGLGGLTLQASSLSRSVGGALAIPEDPTADNPFGDSSGTVTRFLTVGPRANPAVLLARTSSATAPDVDLFVGVDVDGDSVAEPDELLDFSAGATATEEIEIEIPPLDRVVSIWILVQNFDAGPSGTDVVDVLAAAPVLREGRTQFVATGPARTPSLAPFPIGLAVDEPRMQADDTWVGYVELDATFARTGSFGRFPVLVSTANAAGPGAIVLGTVLSGGLPNGRNLDLLPGATHDRIVIDVPANATRMTVGTSGTGEVDLYVARASGADASASAIPPAPARALAQAVSAQPGAAENVVIQAPVLTPGRWYVTPVNTGATRASITLTAGVDTSGDAPVVRANGYFNPSRSGHGVLLSEGGDQRVLIWYTYLPDGTPTWYLAQARRPAAAEGTWRAPLFRFTWDGSGSAATLVGEALMTPRATNAFTFSWLVDGQYGSEPMIELAPRACPAVNGTPTEYSGTWFAPQTPGYGFSVLTYASTEVQVAYLYDAQGVPRWLYGQNAPFGSGNFALSQFTGFCPSCAASAVSARSAGTLVRTLADPASGTTAVSGTFQAPVAGTWSTSQATSKLTDNLGCEGP